MKNVAADQINGYLGLTRVDYVEHKGTLAIIDSTLEPVKAATQLWFFAGAASKSTI